jgi:hypothetical protein
MLMMPPTVRRTRIALALPLMALAMACGSTTEYDIVIRHGTVYDGTGAAGVVQDLAIKRRQDRRARRFVGRQGTADG